MKKEFVLLSLITMLFLLVSCVPTEKVCKVDSDCVPAACCHSTDVVNKENAPDCNGVLCTMNCEPGTLDCAQGEIKCSSGKCKAVLN